MVSPYATAYHAIYTSSPSVAAPSSMSTVSQLMECAAQWKLAPPHFDFSCLGEGPSTIWQCAVVIAGTGAKGEGRNKGEAKSRACAEALRVLPHAQSALHIKPKKEERRKRKEGYRRAMAVTTVAGNVNRNQLGGEAMGGILRSNDNATGGLTNVSLPRSGGLHWPVQPGERI
jgi:hypothetical protein